MPQNRAPSFVRDPDQAAELAALLEDTADELERELENSTGLVRVDRTRFAQTIARYRRWATELTGETEQSKPLQVRPVSWANDPAGRAETLKEATG
jgi:hypothetical protein